MKMPKVIKRYCPYCRKHTEHTVKRTKKGKPRSMTYGSKIRAKRRGASKGAGNLGRYSKPAISKFKMTGRKSTKKTDLRYTCKECKKTHVQKKGFRSKRFELK